MFKTTGYHRSYVSPTKGPGHNAQRLLNLVKSKIKQSSFFKGYGVLFFTTVMQKRSGLKQQLILKMEEFLRCRTAR